MKRTLVMLLAVLILLPFGLSACTPSSDVEESTTDKTDITTNTPESTAPSTSETETSPGQTPPDDVSATDIYPTPMEITYTTGQSVTGAIRPDDTAAKYADVLSSAGVIIKENGLPLSVTLRDLTKDFAYGAEEAYVLTITDKGISIEAQTDRGVHYAFMTLLQLVQSNGSFPFVTVKDAPRNSLRGVIEGFYGTAWSHEYRKDLFAFMGQNKMNAYIYAPKDDAKHRVQWRVLYTGAELERMTDLINTANENYVKFIYALSPGGDINLGAGYEADFEKLMAKCQQMYDLGVRDFAIFLDDIPTLDAEGHGKLLSDFQTRFVETHEGVSDLIAITTEYGDPFLTDYTNKIAPLIHKDVVLMWTGPGVIPESITNRSLQHIIRTYDRNVLIWWNYPVNDTLANHLFMGACVNLEADLYKSIMGLTANPMNQGYASMVPLFTTGDYLWNSEAYDPERSLLAACKALMPDAHEELIDFISVTCASGINKNTDSVELKSLLDALKKDNTAETRAALKAYFEEMVRNADAICASENQKMVGEIKEWVKKYRVYGEMGIIYIEMEEAYTAGKDQSELLKLLGNYKTLEMSIRQNPRLVSASVLTTYLNTLGSRFSILLGQIDGISFVPAKPYTNCNHYEDYTADRMTDGDDSTFFWTAGNLNTAAGNKKGFFGVDLGEIITVENIYIATGVAGGDILRNGIVEYSSDKENWTVLYQGACGDELFLKDLSVKAQYIRVRTADPNDSSWTKVRSFEVNTTRTVASDTQTGTPVLSTNMPTYSTYIPDFMADNDPNTYFWSSRGAQKGDYFEIDLGTVTSVSHITFKSGVPDHAADYVNSGELCYSADGQTWTVICPISSRDTAADVNINARYIRVRVTKDQTSWVTVSEFTAVSEDHVSPLLSLDTDAIARTDLLALTDGLYISFFAPDQQKAQGKTLSVTVGESGKVKLIALGLPESGFDVTVTTPEGHQNKTVELAYDTLIEAPEGSVIHIPLGNGLILAEIEW
ncbi:MAG: beta-N-acetylglucosaminidase domain-containing protein [Clostridia bacterium]|nr:beta-N-acetylglucosaminidase domain-containing protein [Clostridia bacterium]